MPGSSRASAPLPPAAHTERSAQETHPSKPAHIRLTPCLHSPYGSARKEEVHSEELRAERLVDYVPDLVITSDPDDRLPGCTDVALVDAPQFLPTNVEAMAQWCWSRTKLPLYKEHIPVTPFKTCVTLLSELPVRRLRSCFGHTFLMIQQLVSNHWYPAQAFKNRSTQPSLPKALTWTSPQTSQFFTASRVQQLEGFLVCQPWQFEHKGARLFSGIELCWLYLLGILCHGASATTTPDLVRVSGDSIRDGLLKFRYLPPRLHCM